MVINVPDPGDALYSRGGEMNPTLEDLRIEVKSLHRRMEIKDREISELRIRMNKCEAVTDERDNKRSYL